MKFLIYAALGAVSILACAPSAALACACGCNVFDVGANSMLPTDSGGEIYVEDDYMDQSRNWSGAGPAPAANNTDKKIRSDFLNIGVQYQVAHVWNLMVELPVTNRLFRTQDDTGPQIDSFNHTAFGDVRISGTYTGLSDDMSTGLTIGVKLPTGDWRYPGFDRDVEIGSGSTDILAGAYHRGAITKDGKWSYFVQGLAQLPVTSQGGYRPADAVDAVAGVYFNGLSLGGGKISIMPVLQLIGSLRGRDQGPTADPDNSGYSRLLVSPGVSVSSGSWRVYGDVELPVYQNVNGNQLVAPALFKVLVSRSF